MMLARKPILPSFVTLNSSCSHTVPSSVSVNFSSVAPSASVWLQKATYTETLMFFLSGGDKKNHMVGASQARRPTRANEDLKPCDEILVHVRYDTNIGKHWVFVLCDFTPVILDKVSFECLVSQCIATTAHRREF